MVRPQASAPVKSAVIICLQSGLPEEYRRIFEKELTGSERPPPLTGWFSALKWLIKEFRLRVGYETPDEEAGVQFWIDRYEGRKRAAFLPPMDASDQSWPTADEPALAGTAEEVLQASRWSRQRVAEQLAKLFAVKRKCCPETPVLVPLSHLRHYETGRTGSATLLQASLHQFAESEKLNAFVHPQPGKPIRRSLSSAGDASKQRTRSGSVTMSKETRDRLYPSSTAADRPLPDAYFASRVVDLAIEFDGDALRAGRFGPTFLSRAHGGSGDATQAIQLGMQPRAWIEGRDDLKTLDLFSFWTRLSDKAALGLMAPAAKARQVLQDRESGKHFARGIFAAFMTRFAYECLDVGVLYRFWLSMPKAVKSMHHIRGHRDKEAFRFVDMEVRMRSEKKQLAITAPPPQDLAITAARAAVMPFGEPGATPLSELARPRTRGGALSFLQVLVRQFPHDIVLKKMLRQALQGQLPWRGLSTMDYEVYDVFHESRLRSRIIDPRIDPVRNPAVKERIRQLDADEEKLKNDLSVWLISDAERARQTLESLKAAHKVTQKIDNFLLKAASRWIARGANSSLGPLFTSTRNHPGDLRGVTLIEDLFARVCRLVGTWEVVARFGRHYLPTQRLSNALRPPGFLELDVPAQGGPTTDCATQHAACEASSCAPGCSPDCAVDGNPSTGWRPDITQLMGGAWLEADLGRLHSCVGVQLCWVLARCKEATYVNEVSLNQDFELEPSPQLSQTATGWQTRMVVTMIRPQGIAEAAGILPGDYLLLEPGIPPESALVGLAFPARLNFYSADAAPGGLGEDEAAVPQMPVRLSVSKSAAPPIQGEWETLKASPTAQEDTFSVEVAASASADLSVVFVARWIRLEFLTEWPRTRMGHCFQLSIRVVKVWRLAPPSFRMRFLDALRRRARPGNPAGNSGKPYKKLQRPFMPFWASSARRGTFNRKIQNEMQWGQRRRHDFLETQEDLLADNDEESFQLEPSPWEFHSLRSTQGRSLRSRLHAMDEEARECTFHPRAAGHVPRHVFKLRSRGLRDLVDTPQGVGHFVQFLGEDMNSQRYPNYFLVHRRRTLQVARRHFLRGYYLASWRKLKEEFGVENILERYRCFHPGCGRALSTDSEICRCSGYYCPTHKDPAVHNCAQMKKMLAQRAQEIKKLPLEERPKEEKFDNKRELGLLFEVHELAEKIQAAQEEKARKKASLVQLGTALKSNGAIRILERPFKRSMCKVALVDRRKSQAEGGSRVPIFGRKNMRHGVGCTCPRAHSPSELRFPSGESVRRRAAWVAEGVSRVKTFEDVIFATRDPRTEAERKAVKKEMSEKEKAKAKSLPRPRRTRAASYRKERRARSTSRQRTGVKLDGWHPRLSEVSRREAIAALMPPSELVAGLGLQTGSEEGGVLRPSWARDAAWLNTQAADTVLDPPPPPPPELPQQRTSLAELQRSFEAVEGRVGEVLRTCSDMELEHLRQQREQQESETLRQQQWTQMQFESSFSMTAPMRTQPLNVRQGLRKMCSDILDTGRCMLGDTCPYAHHPSELATTSPLDFA